MGLIKLAFSIIGLIILLSIVYVGLLVYSVQKVTVADVRVSGLESVGTGGFTVRAEALVQNAGILPITINHATYKLTLDASRQELASGFIEGKKVGAKKNDSFPFAMTVNWAPLAEDAWDMVAKNQTTATLSGDIYLADLGIISIKRHFEQRIELKDYVGRFATQAPSPLSAITDTVQDVVGTVGEGVKSITGKIVDLFT